MTTGVRVGLIGAGFVAAIHARSYQRIRDIEVGLSAVAAVPLPDAQSFAEQFGIPDATDDYLQVLRRDDIDLVDVCVPNYLHEPFVVAAAQAGKHIICEKPLTGYFGAPGEDAAAPPAGRTAKKAMLTESLKSCDRMLAAVHKAGVKLMYAENWLYCPAVQKTMRLVQASDGAILEIRAQECHSGSHAGYAKVWKYAGGGSLVRLAPHPIGTAIYLKHLEGLRRHGKPIRVASVTAEAGDLSKMPAFQAEQSRYIVDDWQDVENWCALIMAFEDGSRAVIEASDIVLGGMEDTLQVFLSNSRVDCDMTHSGMMRAFAPDARIFGSEYLMEKVGTKAGWSYPSVDEEWLLGYPQEMRDFVESVAYDREPLATADLGRRVVEVIYAAYQSAEEGRRVDLA